MFSHLLGTLSSALPDSDGSHNSGASRSGSADGRSRTPTPRRPAGRSTTSSESRAKIPLDQRLKAAAFVLGDASELNTPNGSGRQSPAKSVESVEPPLTPAKVLEPAEYHLPPSPPPSPTKAPIDILPDEINALGVENTSDAAAVTPAPVSPLPELPESIALPNTNEVELLQTRLKLLEAKFADVSASLLRLQAEKDAANKALQAVIPGKGIENIAELQKFTKQTVARQKAHAEEISRLAKLQSLHDSSLAELRDVHRLESISQSEQIESLKKQLKEAEILLSASTIHSSANEASMKSLRDEVNSSQKIAKDEEEKRVKAVALLKTVRQKLVKTEKERDDALKASQEARQKADELLSKDQAEKNAADATLQRLREEYERKLLELRSERQKEVQQIRAAAEGEISAVKESYETEIHSLKNTFASESAAKQSIVKTLEQSVQSLSREKTELFEQLELRTAELESSQHLLEQVQVQSKELQFHLRDVNDKLSSLQEEIAELRERGNAQGPASGPSDMTTLLLETEGKYAARLGEARNRIRILEQERNQAEEEWSKGSGEHAKALDRLRKLLEDKEKDNASVVERHKEADGVISRLTASLEQSEESNRSHAARLAELETHLAQSREADISSRQDLHDAVERAEACQLQIEALRNQESHLKTQNKSLRDELRKLQSSVALIEKQRNPGVGYWSSANQAVGKEPAKATSRTSISSEDSQGRSAGEASRNEEEVSLEYLRNVILQFLEHKEMRANLVRVLSTILRFTPQETRRLMAKI